MMPEITVIMSVFNGEDFLHSSINSILSQSFTNFEFIIADDASTDSSLKILEEFAINDKRIRLVNNEVNKGLTVTLNKCLDLARGEFIARQDADDCSKPDRLLNFMKYKADNDSVELYSTPAEVIDQSDKVYAIFPKYIVRYGFDVRILSYYNTLIHGTMIIRSSTMKALRYNELFRYAQDFEFYHRFLSTGKSISYVSDNRDYQLRVHSNSISSNNMHRQYLSVEKVLLAYRAKAYPWTNKNRVLFKFLELYFFILKKVK